MHTVLKGSLPINGSDSPARSFTDYAVKIDSSNVPGGVTIEEKF